MSALTVDRNEWPIHVGSFVRIEREAPMRTWRGWVVGWHGEGRDATDFLRIEDVKTGALRPVRASECIVTRPSQAQRMRRGARGEQRKVATALANVKHRKPRR